MGCDSIRATKVRELGRRVSDGLANDLREWPKAEADVRPRPHAATSGRMQPNGLWDLFGDRD
jgi:hypothetical protein